MLASVNRTAVIITPKQALFDWVNNIFPEEAMSMDTLNKHDESTVYLIPEFDSTEESIFFLKENFDYFLDEILFGWCVDEGQWPCNRSWDLFERFVDYSIQSVVQDVVEGDISKEEY